MNKGFTLVELMFTVALVGILVIGLLIGVSAFLFGKKVYDSVPPCESAQCEGGSNNGR